MKVDNRYTKLVQYVFDKYYHPGARKVEFPRSALEDGAAMLKLKLPKNLGDIVYSFRYRQLSES